MHTLGDILMNDLQMFLHVLLSHDQRSFPRTERALDEIDISLSEFELCLGTNDLTRRFVQ